MTLFTMLWVIQSDPSTTLIGSSSTTSKLEQQEQSDQMPPSGFCKGMFMVMSMSGFQWSLTGYGDCLSYFAPGWKLDERSKFQGAMIYTFLLGVVAEGSYALPLTTWTHMPKRFERATNSLLYGLQRFMTYIIMLIAMMYSWELLIAALCGLMVGRLLFPNVTRREWRQEARRTTGTFPPPPNVALPADPTLATDALDESSPSPSPSSSSSSPPEPGEENKKAKVPLVDGTAVRRRR